MKKTPVLFSLKLTDCLQNTVTLDNGLYGQIEDDPLVYAYQEHDQGAQVRIEIREEELRLTRTRETLTSIRFRFNELGEFSIQDMETTFHGDVKTLGFRQSDGFLYLHYRLYANDDLITEQKMELSTKEISA